MNAYHKKKARDESIRIEAEQVCVDYNGTVALYDASLRLSSGCICGLLILKVK